MGQEKYLYNSQLKTILNADEWKGTPYSSNGFVNLEFPFWPNFKDLLKWKLGKNPQQHEKKTNIVLPQVITSPTFLGSDDDMVVWLGHATFFIRINGKTIITDPVFGKLPVIGRLTAFPINPNLLKGIDYILLSHDHRDHCDKESMKLATQLNPRAQVLTGLKLDGLLKQWKVTNTQTAGWFQQYNTPGIEITYLPTRHWGRRGFNDTNQTLWGAFVISSGGKTVYFGADSGFGSHFKQVGELFPNIDVSILGTGAYAPRWFMEPVHMSPEDAVTAFNNTKAKLMLPMHYGTFDLSDEPFGEPVQILRSLETEGKINGELQTPAIGQVVNF
jgi:L-ascorbate metabolism protein UlaG (beta-lactamase superfamily)